MYLHKAECYVHPIMTFLQKLSAYTIGFFTDKDLPDIAMSGLEEGYDSESLRILAGLNSAENLFVLDGYLIKALKELRLKLKERKEALISVISFYANNVVDKKADPYIEFERINEIINKTEFDYIGIDLLPCYADYISIWEVETNGFPLQNGFLVYNGPEKKLFLDKTKDDMRKYLKEWLTIHGNT